MKRTVLFFSFLGMLVAQQWGRASGVPHTAEAQTPQEFDLYLEFYEAPDPEAKHDAALRFEQDYPQSQLLVYVYESELEYARSRNSNEAAIAAGEKALRLAANDLKVLAALAEILPEGTDDAAVLSKAEEYARRVLDYKELLQLPPEVPLQECESLQSFLGSRAHAVLGFVAGKRGQLPLAIREFETAIALSPEPGGTLLFRLGKLYRASKREREAAEMFRRAAKAGPALITKLAEAELDQQR